MDCMISDDPSTAKDTAFNNAVLAYMAYSESQEPIWEAHKLSSEELGRRSEEFRAKVQAAEERAVAAVSGLVSTIVSRYTGDGLGTDEATVMAMLTLEADSEVYGAAAERVFREAKASSNRFAREADERARAEGRPCQPTAYDYTVAATRAAVATAAAHNAAQRFQALITPGEDRRISARMVEATRDPSAWGYNVPGQERRRTEKVLAQSIINTYRSMYGADWFSHRLERLAEQDIIDPGWPRP